MQQFPALINCLRAARDAISPDITVQRLLVLLSVADHPGCSQHDLGQRLTGISSTALSRNLADLSALTSRKLPGPNLIRQQPDPTNLRRKQLHLTRKGQRLIGELKAALESH